MLGMMNLLAMAAAVATARHDIGGGRWVYGDGSWGEYSTWPDAIDDGPGVQNTVCFY